MTTTTPPPTLLIVDDDRSTREGLTRALRGAYQVEIAENGERALAILDSMPVDVMLSDVRMPGMDGLTLLHRALARHPRLIGILLTAYGNVETAVEAMKRGAHDFLIKPVNLDQLELLIKRALRARDLESENRALREQLDLKFGLENMVGNSPAMQQLYETIRQVAPTQATVLVLGESGTGKELVAQALHRLSPRAKGPFVAVHCAALSATLLESELFGHEKGAFTGAVFQKRGRFELADGGTLFLDEIGEIDPSVQVKLLRVLEQRCFERVGGVKPIEVDLRLIAATNRDLRALVDQGRFREDLFFRLDVVSLTIPPLRDRLEDVSLLCDHFIREFAARNNKPVEGITPDALNALLGHTWPGNVRELRNTIEKMVVLSAGPRLTARDLPPTLRAPVRAPSRAPRAAEPGAPLPDITLAEAERRLLVAALARHAGSRTLAAQALGISRRTMHRKLHEYGLAEVPAEAGPATPTTGAADAPV